MTQPGEMYSRIYWSAIEDPAFEGVWEDDSALALWVRMLVDADAAYPVKPRMPIQTKSVRKLIDAGLILVHGNRYTVRGLEKERERRSERGRRGAEGRWGKDRPDADAMQTHSKRNAKPMPTRGEERRARGEESTPAGYAPADATDTVVFFHDQTMSIPRGNALQWLNRLDEEHGPPAVQAAIASEVKRDPSTRTLLGRVEARLASSNGQPKRQRLNDYDSLTETTHAGEPLEIEEDADAADAD